MREERQSDVLLQGFTHLSVFRYVGVYSRWRVLLQLSVQCLFVSEHFVNCTKEMVITNCREYKFGIFSVNSIYIRAEGYLQ